MGPEAMIRRERIERLLRRVIWPATHPDESPLEVSICRLPGEPIALQQGAGLDFEPMSIGDSWGGSWATAWLKATGTIPPRFAGHPVVARVDLGYQGQPGFGGEALVVRDGTPWLGINPRHNTISLTEKAAGGEPIELLLEAAANPGLREGPLEWPLLLPDYDGAPLYRLSRFDLAIVEPEMVSVLYDWTILLELVDELGLQDRRATEILLILDEVAREVDLSDLQTTVVARTASWAPLLRRETRSGAHRVYAVGHAHIDSAWLWPIRETKRKCARTFSTAISLMERDPRFVFVCSQAQQHAWMKESYPELFAKLQRFAGTGQFEPTGSMWVEPDTNLPAGESLRRQLAFGKSFFLEHYGIETLDCWLPDAFGYSGNLPQILRHAGVSRFLTQKLSWNEIDTFPHHTFWWEGIDGSRVLAHCPPTDTYNAEMTVAELLKGERQFAEHGLSNKSLYLYGYGDGGGGPTQEMLERAHRLENLDPLPRLELSSARGFFEAVEEDVRATEEVEEKPGNRLTRTAHAAGPGHLPVWTGELYLERHRGVQTTQARSKLGNRRSERLLREAELWTAAFLTGEEALWAADRLGAAWRMVLLHQFHDILPGSSIHWVHQDSLKAYSEVEAITEEVIAVALARLVARTEPELDRPAVLFCNPASLRRREVVELDLATAGLGSVSASEGQDGSLRRVQHLGDGRALVDVDVPGSGWTRASFSSEAADAGGDRSEDARLEGTSLSNGIVSVTLDDNGNVASIYDVKAGREVLAGGSSGNLFQLHHDLPNHFDGWDIDQHTFGKADDQLAVESIEPLETGPLRASFRVSRRLGTSSRLVQEIRVSRGSRRVDFVTEVDWQERHKLLKVAFPLSVRSPRASFEIQFGYVERPTHANTSWDTARFEVPAQRWAALAEPGFGVSLMNDCKYGYDARANVLRLSLLRGPGWPDPDADVGHHRFSYALYPYGGEAEMAEMVAEAERFNLPVRPLTTAAAAEPGPSAYAPEGSLLVIEGALLSAMKLADDASGELIVRFYEPTGSHVTAQLRGLPAGGVVKVDALERTIAELGETDGTLEVPLGPFELVTLRLVGAERPLTPLRS